MPENTITEKNWNDAYTFLYAQARFQVQKYTHTTSSWKGQEDDLAWDIVLESMKRAHERIKKGENGEREPIRDLNPLLKRIASNYCVDLYRHDKKLQRDASSNDEVNLSEIATENVDNERLFHYLAREIAQFPYKQRQALLIDLASQPSHQNTLRTALQAQGIYLDEYKPISQDNEREYKNYQSNKSHAYNRLKALVKEKESLERM